MDNLMGALAFILIVQSVFILFLLVIAIVNSSRLLEMNLHLARISRSLSGLDESFSDFIHRENAAFDFDIESPGDGHEMSLGIPRPIRDERGVA